MKVAFRVDASLEMGTGHVMRCLTLARALGEQGHECLFICREHLGNLIALVSHAGFAVHSLPLGRGRDAALAHADWLGASQTEDAAACIAVLARWQPEWLVVDHYGLDHHWETAVTPSASRLLVIDDLADRRHVCDVLLDQTFGRSAERYRPHVPAQCRLLCGAQYALLRPEFSVLRDYSLQRRAVPQLRKVLITMGGVDKHNATAQVLAALRGCALPADCQITLVMGQAAPWLSVITEQARQMPWPTEVLVGVNNMAEIMAESDLAIGAAGATVWERNCLGLPSIMMVLADNQRYAAQVLEEAGIVRVLPLTADLPAALQHEIAKITNSPRYLSSLSERASAIVDGKGCQRVLEWIVA